GGNDTFNVNPSLYTSGATNGGISLNGGAGTTDVINLNDQSNATNSTYVVQNNLFNRTNTPNYNYGTVKGLTVNCGSANDIVLVVSTLLATPVTIHGNNGNDDIHIGNAL